MAREQDGTRRPRRRVRVPAALALVVAGVAAPVVAASEYGGCGNSSTEPTADAPTSSQHHDARIADAFDAATDAVVDARPDAKPDAKPDAAPADAGAPDAPPDAPHT